MQTPQASFSLPCESLSANQRKRLDRFLFLLSALSYQSITQKPLHKMTFPLPHPPAPFLGEGETRVRHGQVSGIPRTQSGPWGTGLLPAFGSVGLHPTEHSQLGILREDLWRFTLILLSPSAGLDLCVSFVVHHSRLEGAPAFPLSIFVTPTPVSESSVLLLQFP